MQALVVRVNRKRLPQQPLGGIGVAAREGRRGRRALAIGFALNVALQQDTDHAFRLHAQEFVDDLPVFIELDGGDALYAVLQREALIFIRINRRDHEPSLILLSQLGQDRGEDAAWRAPRCPKVHEHRNDPGPLPHLRVKIILIDFNHVYRTIHCVFQRARDA